MMMKTFWYMALKRSDVLPQTSSCTNLPVKHLIMLKTLFYFGYLEKQICEWKYGDCNKWLTDKMNVIYSLVHSHLNACNVPVQHTRSKSEQACENYSLVFPTLVTCSFAWEAVSHTWFFRSSSSLQVLLIFISKLFPSLFSCFCLS